ncbi:MAG: sporulation initiation inhibitor Soj [Epulopiscium sp. Nele67-Bin005]|nr:MAG: sporulation initiation inhibitor Soj [Epulopiscium sp. Nele67-Bin005]
MSKIISVVNQKGGVGKTTSTINIAASLANSYRVLVIDMDLQGNATSGFGIDKDSLSSSVFDVLAEQTSVKTVIKKALHENIDIIPSNTDLASIEYELINFPKKEFILKNALNEVKSDYDVILIDCPPAINLLTLNALTASNFMLIPMQCEYYALEGLAEVMKTFKIVRQSTNNSLQICGILFTMFDSRTKLANQVVEDVEEHFKELIFSTKINRSVRLSEAPSFGMSCLKYAPVAKVSMQYEEVTTQLVDRIKLSSGSRVSLQKVL